MRYEIDNEKDLELCKRLEAVGMGAVYEVPHYHLNGELDFINHDFEFTKCEYYRRVNGSESLVIEDNDIYNTADDLPKEHQINLTGYKVVYLLSDGTNHRAIKWFCAQLGIRLETIDKGTLKGLDDVPVDADYIIHSDWVDWGELDFVEAFFENVGVI